MKQHPLNWLEPVTGTPPLVSAGATRLLKEKVQASRCLVRNVSLRQDAAFRAAGCCIGAGVVETDCQTFIGGRYKQPGLCWSESGAENIPALQCIHRRRRREYFGRDRLNAQAARNVPSPWRHK